MITNLGRAAFGTLLSTLVTSWTRLETSLGAIARTRDFERDVRPEDKSYEIYAPPSSWPSDGAIEFREVTASHESASHQAQAPWARANTRDSPSAVALHNVSLTIKSGQKVGLCGRTGRSVSIPTRVCSSRCLQFFSGKSSLVATLLRLLEIDNGRITIDGVDISTIPRDIIRQRLVTLPQDPLILVGTVRFNSDPLGRATDEAIISALTDVGLWPALQERGGLDAEVTATSLSKGQQQLFALARAMLQNAKVMLLDEPTSNIDPETDATIQRLLKERCAGCTVLTVAHRMDTILDSDIIVVLDEGKVTEFGSPQELLARNGRFAMLVRG